MILFLFHASHRSREWLQAQDEGTMRLGSCRRRNCIWFPLICDITFGMERSSPVETYIG